MATTEEIKNLELGISRLEAALPTVRESYEKAVAANDRSASITWATRIGALEKAIAADRNKLNQANSNIAQKNSARGQTADGQLKNTATPDPAAAPLTAEQKSKVDKEKNGKLSSEVNQSQDPVDANKQNNEKGTNKAKSEAGFAGDVSASKSGSVVGDKDVTGKNSDYEVLDIQITGVRDKNRLHDYISYTYRLTLFLLTRQDYNALATNPDSFIPTFSLISSGAGFASPGSLKTETTKKATAWGGYEEISTAQTKAGRHPDFQTDFFIDNLQMTTVVGLNAKSKSSNAVEITFNITEPYGLSLLDRLLSACETCGDKNPNYMSQPYLLQIDILSTPNDEVLESYKSTNNVIDTKRIAIKLLEMKIKPTGSGTTYAVRAIPFSHTAFNLTTAALPVPMKIEAGTVGEFFSNTEDFVKLFSGEIKSQEERIEADVNQWIKENTFSLGSANRVPSAAEIEQRRQAFKNARVYNSRSLAAGYNTYMEKIAKDQQLTKLPPTKIAFSIDKEFVNSPIVDQNAQNTDAPVNDLNAAYGQSAPQLRTLQAFNFNAGTSIIDIIDQAMCRSQYIKNQIVTVGQLKNQDQASNDFRNSRERSEDENQPKKLKWYKVVPTVALNDFDSSRNDYSKTILYSILPYTATNPYHPNFPITTAKIAAESVVREYNYLYTGKNEDILRLDIDFDSTYYTQLTTYRNQVARLGTNRFSDTKEKRYQDNTFSFQANSQQRNLPQTVEYGGSNRDSNSMNSATNPEDKIVADLKKSIYTSQRGDLLNIKMQITGDPAFIKQDDIYYNPGSPAKYLEFSKSRTNNIAAPITASGQILFDNQQVYVKVNFLNAVDINDSIGIVNKQDTLTNGRKTDGTFTGVYRVLTVTSDFSRGQFTQTLDLVRMPDVLPEIKKPAGENTQSGTVTQTQDNKAGDEADNSKRSAISRNPAGVAPEVSPRLTDAANQPPVSDPVVISGQGNPQARPNTYQSAPQNANNAQNIAPQNTSGWSFADTFRQARKDFGNKPGGVFEWRGKLYQTNYQNEPFVANPKPVYPGANQ